MSIRSTILFEIQQLAENEGKKLPELADETAMLNLGLDSLAIAILVSRLEEVLNSDPFTAAEDVFYPVTLGDFIRTYERAAEPR